MKKISLIIFIILSVFILTGCNTSEIEDAYDKAQSSDGCDGWKENGECCTAKYSGQSTTTGSCPGAQLNGEQIGHGLDHNKCYYYSCG